MGVEGPESRLHPRDSRDLRIRNAAVFCVVAAAWIAADRLSKGYFESAGDAVPGASPLPWLFEFDYVQNIGAAWGLFGGAAVGLVVLAVIVCAFILIYLFILDPESNLAMTIGLSLVFAGGIGNMVDRVEFGYVTDFISLSFMDFPVFNVADIGVTCGFAIFLLGYVIKCIKNRKAS